MSTGLIDIMKRSALDAMNNAQMTDLRFGEVVDTDPLKVQVTHQFTLPSSLLIVPEHLTDRDVKVTINWNNDADSTEDIGTKTVTIHNSLRIGDKVALLRKQGGQSYFILDRI